MKHTIYTAAAFLLFFGVASAQITPKKIIERKVNDRVNRTIAQKTDEALDTLLTEKKTPPKTNEPKTVPATVKTDTVVKPIITDQPPLQSYSQYDFVPGDSLLFFEDYSQDALGDFPALWTTNKTGEVNTLNIAPGKWLNLNATEGNWWYLKPLGLPRNFIFEFDVVPKKGAPRYAVGVAIYGEDKFKEMSDPYSGKTGLVVNVSKYGWEALGLKSGAQRITGYSNLNPVKEEKVNHVIIWIQNRRVRIYHGGAKVLDMPTMLYEDSKFNRLGFMLYRGASCAAYMSNIKISTASPDTRSKLITEGKLVSYGIYFDVNKDAVKPESYGTLNSIAQVLRDNPAVRIRITGHTDADGDNAANLDLSRRRATSVKLELANTFGIEATRMETDGKGETQPVAANDTPANKALNRRVEFIKL